MQIKIHQVEIKSMFTASNNGNAFDNLEHKSGKQFTNILIKISQMNTRQHNGISLINVKQCCEYE